MAPRTRESGADDACRLRPECEETPCASSRAAPQGTLPTSLAADRHAQTLAATTAARRQDLTTTTCRHPGTVAMGTSTAEVMRLVGTLRHGSLSRFRPRADEEQQGPGAPPVVEARARTKGPDRYQRAPSLSTQRRTRELDPLSPDHPDPDAHRVRARLAHLHCRLDPTFTSAPKLASQAHLRRRRRANPLGPDVPARPGPKRARLSCDPNWIHSRDPTSPVVPERGPGPPSHPRSA